MEGLFRNGANPSHENNIVSVNVLTEQVFGEEKKNAVYAKLIFFLKNKSSADMIQIIYHNKNMDMSSIMRVAYIKDLPGKIKYDREKNRKLLFALFEMFYLNRSISIGSLLKEVDSSFIYNREALNANAVSLYRRYRNKLRNNDQKGQSILKFEAEKKKVGSFYRRNESVKLVKVSESFFWKVDLKNVNALFTNEKHQLQELELNAWGDKFNVSTDGFGIFSKTYELPKAILFQRERAEFSFETLKFKTFNGSERYMNKTAKKYMAYEEKFRKNKFKIKSLLKDGLSFYY